MSSKEGNDEEDCFWINPCGFDDELESESGVDPLEVEDKQVICDGIDSALESVRIALRQLEDFKEYLKKNNPSINMENLQESSKFDFLKFSESDFDSFMSNDLRALIPIDYNCVQRHAVALQQMITDATDSDYLEYLKDKKGQMRTILCSLDVLIRDLRRKKHPDPSRNIMPNELTVRTSTLLVIRDIIFVKRYLDVVNLLKQHLEKMKNEYGYMLREDFMNGVTSNGL